MSLSTLNASFDEMLLPRPDSVGLGKRMDSDATTDCTARPARNKTHAFRPSPAARMPPAFSGDGSGEESPPSPAPDVPAGAMVTCSADNTVRIWDLGALDGNSKGAGEGDGHTGRSVRRGIARRYGASGAGAFGGQWLGRRALDFFVL